MDSQKFDGIARTLATGSSRRSVLRGMFGGALAAVGLSRAGDSLAAASKTGVCHYTGSATNPWQYIDIADAAVDTHLAHGDDLFNLGNSEKHCGTCGNTCTTAVANASPLCTAGTCGYVCNTGYEDDGEGGCAPVATYNCYWLTVDGTEWIERGGFVSDNTFAECQELDSCSGCGGDASGGGCYKWATSTADPGLDFCAN